MWEEITDASIADSNFNSVKDTETNENGETMQAEKGQMPWYATSPAHCSLVGYPFVAVSAWGWLLLGLNQNCILLAYVNSCSV